MIRFRQALLGYAILMAMTSVLAHVEDGNVYYTDKNGSGATRVSSSGTVSIMGPAWNSDGNKSFTCQPIRVMEVRGPTTMKMPGSVSSACQAWR